MQKFLFVSQFLVFSIIALSQCSNNLIENGDFELDNETGWRVTGTGWESFADPDLHNIQSPIPIINWIWEEPPIESTQGGNWQNLFGGEIIWQTINLIPGTRYRISFEMANFKIRREQSGEITTDSSSVEIQFGFEPQFDSEIVSSLNTWRDVCYSFVAEEENIVLRFRNSTTSYVALDNIKVVEEDLEYEFDNSYRFCLDDEFIIPFTSPVFIESFWSDGQIGETFIADIGGNYWVDLEYECGIIRENFEVILDDCGCKLYIPNIFSPSLSNESLYEVSSSCPLESYDMKIFDRWGNHIFSSNNIIDSWNGRINNLIIDAGNYAFKVDYNFGNNPVTKTGIVTVLE